MAFDELKKDLIEVETNMRSYLKNSDEYVRLKIFKILMRSITSFAQILVVGSVFLIAILLLSFAVSFSIGKALDNLYYGFLIVGLCYIIFGIICYVFREKFNKPLIKRFSKYYFEEI